MWSDQSPIRRSPRLPQLSHNCQAPVHKYFGIPFQRGRSINYPETLTMITPYKNEERCQYITQRKKSFYIKKGPQIQAARAPDLSFLLCSPSLISFKTCQTLQSNLMRLFYLLLLPTTQTKTFRNRSQPKTTEQLVDTQSTKYSVHKTTKANGIKQLAHQSKHT
jgi:hypothetical protein